MVHFYIKNIRQLSHVKGKDSSNKEILYFVKKQQQLKFHLIYKLRTQSRNAIDFFLLLLFLFHILLKADYYSYIERVFVEFSA